MHNDGLFKIEETCRRPNFRSIGLLCLGCRLFVDSSPDDVADDAVGCLF